MFAGSVIGWAGGAVFSGLILYAATRDVQTRRIPNRVVAVLAAAGFGFALAAHGIAGSVTALAGLGVGFVCWLPFYIIGWLGAGDVKLFAAAGMWLGPVRAFEGSLIAALAGAVLALGWMLWSYGARRTTETLSVATAAPTVLTPQHTGSHGKRTLPYGVALAVGALAAGWLPRTVLFQ